MRSSRLGEDLDQRKKKYQIEKCGGKTCTANYGKRFIIGSRRRQLKAKNVRFNRLTVDETSHYEDVIIYCDVISSGM